MKFSDVPKRISNGEYSIDVSWEYLEHILGEYTEQGLELNPDFQRGHVWNEEQQVAYVEFVMGGGRSSKEILFNCSDWGTNYAEPIQCVDGLQRLTAVRAFLDNKIRAFGRLKKDYTGLMDLDCRLTFNVNNLKTRAEVLEWYLQLNGGGTPHAQEELDRVRSLLLDETEEFFAIYDEQIEGFKAGMIYSTYEEAENSSADRAYELSQGDEEPIVKGASSKEINDLYGYIVIKVSKEDAVIIGNSEEVGLLTKVEGIDEGMYL